MVSNNPTSVVVLKEPTRGYLDCHTRSNIGVWWVSQGEGVNPTSMMVSEEPTRGYLDCNTQLNIGVWWVSQGEGVNLTSMMVSKEPTRGYLDCNTQSDFYMWWVWSEVYLNYWVIVDMYPNLNGVVGGLIPTMKSSLYFMKRKKTS